jgi:hypothetical protein
MPENDTCAGGIERFRCEECGEPADPTGEPGCDECGGRIREYIPMTAPVYRVHVPSLGRLWFGQDDYSLAFEHATGETVDEAGDDHEWESEITIVDFDGVVGVPVADV